MCQDNPQHISMDKSLLQIMERAEDYTDDQHSYESLLNILRWKKHPQPFPMKNNRLIQECRLYTIYSFQTCFKFVLVIYDFSDGDQIYFLRNFHLYVSTSDFYSCFFIQQKIFQFELESFLFRFNENHFSFECKQIFL